MAKGVDMLTADQIRGTRRQLGLNQWQFAELLRVSVWTIRNWEQDKRTPCCVHMERAIMSGIPLFNPHKYIQRHDETCPERPRRDSEPD